MPSTFRLKEPQREVGSVDQEEGVLPMGKNTKPGKRFVAIHWPDAWSYDEEHGFLPSVRDILAQPGVNGQKVGKDGRTNMTPAISDAAQKGAVVLHSNDTRLGEFKDYLAFYPIQGGGKWYCWACAQPTVLPSGRIIWNDEEQEQWLKRFSAHLRDAGIVPPLLPEVYEDMRERMAKRLDNIGSRAGNNPVLQAKYEEARAKLEAMEAAWAASLDEEASKAKATGKGSKPRARKVSTKEVSDG